MGVGKLKLTDNDVCSAALALPGPAKNSLDILVFNILILNIFCQLKCYSEKHPSIGFR